MRNHTRLTSAKVLDRFKIIPKGELILLEDIREQVRLTDKVWAAAVAKLVPLGLMGAFVPGLDRDKLDATATVIFTSGSTGDPKGVVLSHRNVLSNVQQVEEAVRLKPKEVLLGVLPFFHWFGFTITIWTAILPEQEGCLSLTNPARCPHDRQDLRSTQGNTTDGHAVVFEALLEKLRPCASSKRLPTGSWGPKSSSPSWPATSRPRRASSRW